jgi:hypothetical protein
MIMLGVWNICVTRRRSELVSFTPLVAQGRTQSMGSGSGHPGIKLNQRSSLMGFRERKLPFKFKHTNTYVMK